MTRLSMLFLFMIFITATSCSQTTGPADGGEPPITERSYKVVKAFPNLTFQRPLGLRHPGDGSNHLFVVEQQGVIYRFQNDSTTTEKSVFLDIRDRVIDGGERGLLGLAFHPNFEMNGYFYVNYTADNPLHTVISRFEVDPGNGQVIPGSETIILTFEQPFANHNGGAIRFGPAGYLFIGTGDGGSSGDPRGNAQDRTALLGKILRIDVNNSENNKNYSIPPDNPYAGNKEGFREEIYAYGFRNPWRFSFDPKTGTLWVGDVGQGQWEEIDIVEKGGNYGWNIMEGDHCYNSETCDKNGLILPIFEYSHSAGQSITGGFVYRGERLPGLKGLYIYADFISGRIWALDFSDNNPQNTLLIHSDLNISSFGTDANNELYICSFDGFIYRLEPVED